MKLKQEDRQLFSNFFSINKSWMKSNSLNDEENLNKFKMLFIEYMMDEKQSENLSFMTFILVLDQEIIESKKQVLIKKYQNNIDGNNIDGSLYLRSVFRPLTDNVKILAWINQSNIVHEVSRADMARVEERIKQELLQNKTERTSSCEGADNQRVYKGK